MIETDVVAIGSGAAGLTAGISARANSDWKHCVRREDGAFGGIHRLFRRRALDSLQPRDEADRPERQPCRGRDYLHAVLGAAYNDDLVASYLDTAAAMLRFMERNSAVRFKPFPLPRSTSRPARCLRGSRSLLTQEFDGRLLGARLADLRMPLAQLMLFGSTAVAGADIHPMRHALKTCGPASSTRRTTRRPLVLDRGSPRPRHTASSTATRSPHACFIRRCGPA